MDNKSHIPDWKLERYLLGELPAGELTAIGALAAGDYALRERIAALRSGGEVILEAYPPEQAAKRIRNLYLAEAAISAGRRKAAEASRAAAASGFIDQLLPSRSAVVARVAFACAAVLAAIMIPMVITSANHPIEMAYEDRVKGVVSMGGAAIEVWRKEGETALKLAPESAVREGDIVQLRYTVPERCYGMLLSVDGRGTLTVHLTGTQGNAVELAPGRTIALPHSYELDDAPQYEIFYLITASSDFDAYEVRRSLESAEHPIKSQTLPQGQNVTAFALRKLNDLGMR